MEQQEKQFKRIEVIDSLTKQTYKVACMSCIRGHRVTSCGIPACRSKVFWTVNRPGRPSGSCNCRFLGLRGPCQCVVAKPTCPHKPKKGEKRKTVECRCDEQGRHCCLLDSEQWDTLKALQKPFVDFFATVEALQTNLLRGPPKTYTPSISYGPTTPRTPGSLPSTPSAQSSGERITTPQSQSLDFQPQAYQPPRFGMMGVGSPMGSEGHQGEDVLKWEGQAPQAPREFRPYGGFNQSPSESLNQTQPAGLPPNHTASAAALAPPLFPTSTVELLQNMDLNQFPPPFQAMSMLPQAPNSTIDFDKFTTDYMNYQFPNAICQHCGMNGCTCKNCPAVMQSSVNGSWAQCCSRKHAHRHAHPPVSTHPPIGLPPTPHEQQQQYVESINPAMINQGHNSRMTGLPQDETQPPSTNIGIDDLTMFDGQDPMSFGDWLMSDLEQRNQNQGQGQGHCHG